MRLPRFTLRTMMVAVAISALLCLLVVMLRRRDAAYQETYGPDGYLVRRTQYQGAAYGARWAMIEGRYEEAEGRFREALALAHRDYRVMSAYNAIGRDSVILAGLAEAVALQGQLPEAEALFSRAIAEARREFGQDDPVIIEIQISRAGALQRGAEAARALKYRLAPTHPAP